MKTVLTLIFILFMCSVVSAADGPFSPGSKSIGGAMYFTHLSGDAYTTTSMLNLTPKYTVCVSDGFFIGGVFQLSYISIDGGFYDYSDTQWEIGGVFEKYIVTTSNPLPKAVPYFKGSIMVGNNDSVTKLAFGAGFGTLFMVSNSIGLDLGVLGSYDRFSSHGNSVNGFTLQAGMGISTFIF